MFSDYIKQSPLIPVLFSSLLTLVILMQCFAKRRFLKGRLLLSFVLTFTSVLVLVFYDEIINSKEIYAKAINYILFGVDVLSCLCLLSAIDLTLSNEKLSRELTKNLDETKLYVMLDKKDKIKEISKKFIFDLGVDKNSTIGKNIFDVIENKYTIIGLNGEEIYKKEIKKYYDNYSKKVKEDETNQIIIEVQDERNVVSSLYFDETPIFINSKYKGRILVGDKKSEETLMGLEKELASVSSELDIIKNRFITILNNTSDGIYFHNLNNKTIWFNDILVQRLYLNGNSISSAEFYNNIHKEDKALYSDVMNNIRTESYSVTYRYNTGAYYVFVKEEGRKIVTEKNVELCGIMSVLDDYRFEKTETTLDTISTEPQMMVKFKELQTSESIFEVVYFKVASIPDVNEKYGRAYGNMLLAKYISFFKERFVVNNLIYRVSGLEFVAFITNYNKMEALKNMLRDNEKILHLNADLGGDKIAVEVFMGISLSNDTVNTKDTILNAKNALKIASNPQYKSSYAYYSDIK